MVNPADYTNRAGTFDGIRPTMVMTGVGEDITKRLAAFRTIQEHPVAFVVSLALQSMPLGAPGSATQQAFDKFKCKLKVEALKDATVDAILDIIADSAERLGVEEPEGSMSAARGGQHIRPHLGPRAA